jgi:SNF2 family DNA or RNA helicase
VSLSAAERELYETARLAAATAITAAQTPNQRFAVLGWLTRLRRLSCHPRLFHDAWTGAASKLDAFLALVEELRATGHRALVFSQFTDHLALVRRRSPPAESPSSTSTAPRPSTNGRAPSSRSSAAKATCS